MKRLIFFTGVYDTLDLFEHELKKEFERLGCQTMVFDVQKMSESLLQLSQFAAEKVDAAITMNNLGVHMEVSEGHNLWEELGIPCINILMDHPFCYHSALSAAPSNSIVLCTDRNHMNYLSRFYPNLPVVGYLPHAGIEIEGEKKQIKDRSIDVMYAGNLSRKFAPNIIQDLTKYHEFDARKVCEEAYYELISHPYKTTEQALEEKIMKYGGRFDDARLAQIIADLHFVDLYAVSYFREKTVQTIAESGVRMELYGLGWEDCDWIHLPNLYYGGKIAADEVVRKMQDAKVVLSTMTWFKDGTHDRVFNGMLQGAVAVSDSSVYMKEEFCGKRERDGQDCREMILFELNEIPELPGNMRDVWENGRLAQQIADRGYEKAKKSHTWRNRALEIKTEILDNRELMASL